MMEDLCERFPSISKMLFENLDDQSLVKVKESSLKINNHLQNERFYWVRIIKKHFEQFEEFELFEEFADAWKKVIDKTPVETVRKLAITVEDYFNYFFDNDHVDVIYRCHGHNSLHPLHVAAEMGNLSLCEYIAEKTGEFNPKLADNCTALHFAAERGHLEVYKFILNNVEDKNPKSLLDGGKTPYDCAIANDRVELARFIIENLDLDDINPKNHLNSGGSPLHTAAFYGYYDMCKLIIDKIEDKNPASDLGGWTPLHSAAQYGHVDICKMIVSYLDDKNPSSNDGTTPKDKINAYFKHVGVQKNVDDLFQ